MIRRARPEEAAALTELALAAKKHWGYPEAWIDLWRKELRFSPDSVREDQVFVFEEGGSLLGVVSIAIGNLESEMEDLWVHPEAMGRGIGRALFEHAVGVCLDEGVTEFIIVSDPHAEAFYLKMGATRIGEVTSKPAGRLLPKLVCSVDKLS